MTSSTDSAPTHSDPTLAAASELIGGPAGRRRRPASWWTPVRVVMAVAGLVWMLGMAQDVTCANNEWVDSQLSFHYLCYSDLPTLYASRGLAELYVPYTDNGGRYPDLEYPVLTGYFAYGSAWLTQALGGFPDLTPRRDVPAGSVPTIPLVQSEGLRFTALSAVLLGLASVVAAGFLARVHRGRPWDALYYAAAPVVALSGFINWDILAVLSVAIALWAWSRGRPGLAGVMIGLGTATKLYPVLLLGALIVVAWRRRDRVGVTRTVIGAAVAWFVVNLPAMLLGFSHWASFWTFNADREASFGSTWLFLDKIGLHYSTSFINMTSMIVFAGWCLVVLLIGLLAPHPPRVAQIAFLVLVGFLIVNKVYSPQYVLWLIPIAALARPRWRDLMIWQAGEIFYFAAVWWYLGQITASPGGSDHFYPMAIVVRLIAELYLVGVVVRDILAPWNDKVRGQELDADPMWPQPAERGLGEPHLVDVGGRLPDPDVDGVTDRRLGDPLRQPDE